MAVAKKKLKSWVGKIILKFYVEEVCMLRGTMNGV